MFDRTLLTALALLALLSIAATCENAARSPLVLSPQAGQLLRHTDSFLVEIEAPEKVFDLSTLEVDLNGDALEVVLGESTHQAILGAGQSLSPDNELVVSAVRKEDSLRATRSVAFEWAPLPADIEFKDDFVDAPPPVISAEVELLDPDSKRQNALLHVRFRTGFDAPSRIPYRVDEQTVYILRDDGAGADLHSGDGLYSARVDFDYNRYALRRAQSLVGLGQRAVGSEKFSFNGRELVAREPVDFQSDLSVVLDAGKGGAIPLFPREAQGSPLDSEQALVIRHPSVVADPNLTFDPCDIDGDGNLGNPDGAWTFKTLMTAMANESRTGISPEEFVREWVATWEVDGLVNQDVVPSRSTESILDGWQEEPDGPLDLDRSPFRLLAIVNRLDLRDAVGYGTPGTAGELRFVFGLVDSGGADDGGMSEHDETGPGGGGAAGEREPGDDLFAAGGLDVPGGGCGMKRMSIILEYKVDAESCQDVLAYAEAWESLDQDPGHIDFDQIDPADLADFLVDLQAITDTVVLADSAPNRPNGNALGQLRTNERVLGVTWEMREFALQPMPGTDPSEPQVGPEDSLFPHFLRLDTAKQTPDAEFASSGNEELQALMAGYINDVDSGTTEAICNGDHVVPLSLQPDDLSLPTSTPFLAGRADFFFNNGLEGTFFSAPGIQDWVDPDGGPGCNAAKLRFNFSSATCTGCHGADTLDFNVDPRFYHIDPTVFIPGEGAQLSRFMTGTQVEGSDPDCCPIPDPSSYDGPDQHFNDLMRRAEDMQALLDTQCLNLMVASSSGAKFVH
ncbi:MAG: hypothetical protein VX252_01620 [Myxococcota bacterium]|nr:hypothetical protein [Myxococcota bacterium]